MPAFKHGGDLSDVQKSYPDAPLPWIDLSTGINPNPYPWQRSIPENELINAANKLPQENELSICVQYWTDYLNAIDPDEWFLVSGSQAFINIIPRIFPDHRCIISSPTYNEHERIWKQMGRNPLLLPHNQITSYEFDANSVLIITNPNNPDGYVWGCEGLIDIAQKLSKNNGVLIVDEAFADLNPSHSLANINLPENIIIMRSFGKFFGLAGLRLGIIRTTKIIRFMVEKEVGPWSVNALAIKIALYALNDRNWIEENKINLLQRTQQLRELLTQFDFKLIGGTDLFSLVTHDDINAMNDKLNRNGIYVRTFNRDNNLMRFGLPKGDAEFHRLKEALKWPTLIRNIKKK